MSEALMRIRLESDIIAELSERCAASYMTSVMDFRQSTQVPKTSKKRHLTATAFSLPEGPERRESVAFVDIAEDRSGILESGTLAILMEVRVAERHKLAKKR